MKCPLCQEECAACMDCDKPQCDICTSSLGSVVTDNGLAIQCEECHRGDRERGNVSCHAECGCICVECDQEFERCTCNK